MQKYIGYFLNYLQAEKDTARSIFYLRKTFQNELE